MKTYSMSLRSLEEIIGSNDLEFMENTEAMLSQMAPLFTEWKDKYDRKEMIHVLNRCLEIVYKNSHTCYNCKHFLEPDGTCSICPHLLTP